MSFDNEAPRLYETFHVELTPRGEVRVSPDTYHWHPLAADGTVPALSYDGLASHMDMGAYAGKDWTQLPDDTRLGWRGPMILERDLDECPPIFNGSVLDPSTSDSSPSER